MKNIFTISSILFVLGKYMLVTSKLLMPDYMSGNEDDLNHKFFKSRYKLDRNIYLILLLILHYSQSNQNPIDINKYFGNAK